MRILGCDYSTHYVDFVAIEDDKPPEWVRLALEGQDSFDRARSVGEFVPSSYHTFWDDVLAVGIEEPAGRNTGHLFRVQGAILARIPARMLVEKWMPSQWRKAVGLPGNASKKDVLEYVDGTVLKVVEVGSREGPSTMSIARGIPWPQDAADAYCIAVATLGALQQDAA